MDREGDGPEDETLDLTEDMELDETEQETDGDRTDSDEEEAEQLDDGEETVISFGDEEDASADQEGDSSVIRRLRQELRDAKARARELETANIKPTIEVGDKPTLAACDFDEERFETELDQWKERKRAADAEVEEVAEREKRVQQSWQQDVQAYEQRKASIGVSDFAEAEDTVKGTLNMVQQAVIVKAANDPAALIVALSRSPAKLAELAKFEDPIKMAAAIARMEGTVKVVKRAKGPAIDRPQNGSGRMQSSDKRLQELEAKAEKSGDRTELVKYKKKLKERGK